MIRIHAIRTGSVAIKECQRVGRGTGQVGRQISILTDKEWTEPLPIYAWAIEHPEGVIVVDTGEQHEQRNEATSPNGIHTLSMIYGCLCSLMTK